MTFQEWKQRSRAYRKAVASAGEDREAKKIESLCRAAFVAGVDWGLETYEAKVGARRTELHNAGGEATGAALSREVGSTDGLCSSATAKGDE